ncbi:MAG: ATP-binding cassette domain-containing protein, partial [Candidatus Latescibacterota bacterium]
MSEAEKIIYSMRNVSKHYNRKKIIEDISLSYFYGAKIGVLGLNGSGKSTLLRIMAGVDGEFEGNADLSPGYTVGYMEQEPQLEDGKTVREIVEQGVQDTVNLVREYEDINNKFAEPMDDDAMNALIERQSAVAEKLDAAGAWDLD